MGAFPKLSSAEYGLHHCSVYSLGVAIWSLELVFLLNSMLIISSVPPIVWILFWMLLNTLFLMSVLLVKRLLQDAWTAWRNRNEGCLWAVKLDVRDLGGPFGCHSSCCSWYFDQQN